MYPSTKKQAEVQEVVHRIHTKMQQWGVTMSFLAEHLGVSRQYAWQIVHYRTFLSHERALEIERHLDGIIAQQLHLQSFGDRLRAARLAAGLTLKEVASLIGYSWVGVERWERNICRPKPGVLWHLLNVYGAAHTGSTRDGAYTFQDLRDHLTSRSRYARAG